MEEVLAAIRKTFAEEENEPGSSDTINEPEKITPGLKARVGERITS